MCLHAVTDLAGPCILITDNTVLVRCHLLHNPDGAKGGIMIPIYQAFVQIGYDENMESLRSIN